MGGKSYFYSIAVILHTIIFDGVKYYTQETIDNPPKAELCVGSGQANKSSDFCKKIEDAMTQLATDPDLGVWGKFGENEDYEPSIFYKEMSGSLSPNNKAKNNMWRHEYSVLSDGRETLKGTGSYLAHVVYSPNKPDGAEAAAGGRYNYIIYEEQGLCFGKGTKIRMANGEVKNVEKIGIGDFVLGEDGLPKKIISVYEGVDNLYKISQAFGQDYIVNSKHRLKLYEKYNGANTYHTITPEDFLKWSNARRRETYGFKNKKLNFKKKDLLVDPYFLGVWLGDGDKDNTRITTIDNEIKDYLKYYSNTLGLTLTEYIDKRNKVTQYSLVGKKGKTNFLRNSLKELNVFKNKHIPKSYLFSSVEQRLQLLAGLIDTDGCLVFKGKPAQKFEIYVSKNKEFVDQIEFLVTSLGLKCTVREYESNKGFGDKIIENRKKYTIRITGDICKIPVKIKRKIPINIIHKKDHLKTSIKVEKIGFGEYYGFALENDDLFLLKDGTVVHNTPLLIKAWGSNKSTVAVGARQFGVQIALGTSGNMDTVQPAKEIFTHPRDFNLVTFVDVWEESGEIGFFLPAYMTASDFKDENGNTNYDEAIEFYLKSRNRAEESNNPQILSIEKMNNPLFPSDMWQSDKGNILPVAEAQLRERGLLNNKLYEKNYTPVKFHWDSSKPRGVDYQIDKERKPFFEHKYRYERDDLDGPIMIYEFPQEIHGVVPNDMYKFIGHDPYVSDNIDEGDSLGATYIIMNPKYLTEGFSGNCIVASYIGKPNGGRKEYYENLEKLLAFYGNPIRGLWFEANRGDECKNFFVNKDKQFLLALRPQNINSANIYQRKITQYGYLVGGTIGKADLLDKVHDWLLEPTTIGDETLLNIERIPDIFLIRQIIAFDMKTGNYDAVMALAGAILGIREEEKNIIDEIKNKNKHNPLAFLSQNSRMFKNADPLNTLERKMRELNKEEQKIDNGWVNEWELNPSQRHSKKWN